MAKIIKGKQTLNVSIHNERHEMINSLILTVAALMVIGYCFIFMKFSWLYFLFLIPTGVFLANVYNHYRQIQILKAGRKGEEDAVQILADLLPKEYTILNCNIVRYGEHRAQVDNIIVGPCGVFACEVKALHGLLKGRFDQRDLVQISKRGKKLSRKALYNPIMQVSAHVEIIRGYLEQEGLHVPVRGMVYFTGGRVRLDIEGNPHPIYTFTDKQLDKLKAYVTEGKDHITEKQIKDVIHALT